LRRILRGITCVIAFFVIPQTFAQPLTGTWNGVVVQTSTGCNPDVHHGGPGVLNLTQSGNQISGTFTFEVRLADCKAVPPRSESFSFAGTTSGDSFNVSFPVEPGLTVTLSGSVSGDVMVISFSAGDTTGEGVFSRAGAPPANFAGTWRGTFMATATFCTPPVAQTIPATLNLSQSGSILTGSLVVQVSQGECSSGPGSDTLTIPLSATISGNSFTGPFNVPDFPDSQISGFINGGTLSVAFSVGDTAGVARMSGGSGTRVAISSFSATPNRIRAGDSTSLSWTTVNASSVTINQAIGTQSANGSVEVSPSTTTTYILTANGTGGSTIASVTVEVITAAEVRVTLLPSGLVQAANSGGATTRYALFNAGGAASNITLGQDRNFFTQSPGSFTLASGATQIVTITGTAQAAGTYSGASLPTGEGVPAGLSIPVTMLSAEPPTAPAIAVPTENRSDVSAPPEVSSLPGTVRFTNRGTGIVRAIAVGDVAWLGVGAPDIITIEPGATVDVSFTIDRSKRPDAASPLGSVSGNLALSYLSGSSSGKIVPHNGGGVSNSYVTVVDTARPTPSTSPIPPLQPGEVAYFIPGVSHVQDSRGLFLSDLSILNHSAEPGINDLRIFYTAAGSDPAVSSVSSLGALAANQPLALADIVKTTFLNEAQVGTIQIRTTQFDKISVAANRVNTTNPAGTYGTIIPVFRSDRSLAPGATLTLAGLRANETGHTDLYLQETGGFSASVTMEFFDDAGNPVGTARKENLPAYGLLQLGSAVPIGAVSARVTNDAQSSGRVVAYATPVDRLSGDSWAVVDWRQQLGYSPAEPVMIPVAGSLRGRNNSFFRTDAALMNTGAIQATGSMRYYPQLGEPIDREISLAPRQSRIIHDVVRSLFGLTDATVGYLVYTPTAGAVAVTSRNYTTVEAQGSTFGTEVPALAVSSSLTLGELKRIGGLEDATHSTITTARPGTFRTNFALIEASGQPATVRITMRYISAEGKSETRATASKEFVLAPRQFLLLSNVARQILGLGRDTTFGDARNLQLDFVVTEGEGSVILFTSSIDNGTNDSTLRTE
jgi:hypothetical protein